MDVWFQRKSNIHKIDRTFIFIKQLIKIKMDELATTKLDSANVPLIDAETLAPKAPSAPAKKPRKKRTVIELSALDPSLIPTKGKKKGKAAAAPAPGVSIEEALAVGEETSGGSLETTGAPEEKKPKRRTKKPAKAAGAAEDTERPPETITLMPHQILHFDRLKEILKRSPVCQDLSMAGSGKTFTSAKMFFDPDFQFKHLVVICPVSVQPKWVEMQKKYGVNIVEVISYCSVRSLKCKQPKHGLLFRRDYKTMTENDFGRHVEVDHVEFIPTDKFKKLVEEGLLLIIDEIQNIKNVTSQFVSCQTMIRYISRDFDAFIKTGSEKQGKSRIILLSGSPIDNRKQVITMLRAMNIMKSDMLTSYNPIAGRISWKGMQEIMNYITDNNLLKPDQINHHIYNHFRRLIDAQYARSQDLVGLVYDLYQNVIKKHIASEMPLFKSGSDVTLNKRNYIYNLNDPEMSTLLRKGVNSLRTVTGGDDTRAEIRDLDDLHAVISALTMIETAKISTFIRISRTILTGNPMAKVVICVNYTATIEDIAAGLAEYTPLVLNGSMNAKQRGEVIDKFQAHTTESRVLLCNVYVASTGIDLDDKHGDMPRHVLISPNYSTITLYQLSHRFKRADTKSASHIHMVFCKPAIEKAILDSLSRKSDVMKQTTEEQAAFGVVFPGDYPVYNEEEHGIIV